MLIKGSPVNHCSNCEVPITESLICGFNPDFCPYCGEQLYESVKKEYKFNLTETFVKTVSIFARSETEAFDNLYENYDKGEIEIKEFDNLKVVLCKEAVL